MVKKRNKNKTKVNRGKLPENKNTTQEDKCMYNDETKSKSLNIEEDVIKNMEIKKQLISKNNSIICNAAGSNIVSTNGVIAQQSDSKKILKINGCDKMMTYGDKTLKDTQIYANKMIDMIGNLHDESEFNSEITKLFNELVSLITNSKNYEFYFAKLSEESLIKNINNDDKDAIRKQILAIFVNKSLENNLLKLEKQASNIRKIIDVIKNQNKYKLKKCKKNDFFKLLELIMKDSNEYVNHNLESDSKENNIVDEVFESEIISDQEYENISEQEYESGNISIQEYESEQNSGQEYDNISEQEYESGNISQQEYENGNISEKEFESEHNYSQEYENISDQEYESEYNSCQEYENISDQEYENISEQEYESENISEKECESEQNSCQEYENISKQEYEHISEQEYESENISEKESINDNIEYNFKSDRSRKEIKLYNNSKYIGVKTEKKQLENIAFENKFGYMHMNGNLHNNTQTDDIENKARGHMLFRDIYGRCYIAPSLPELTKFPENQGHIENSQKVYQVSPVILTGNSCPQINHKLNDENIQNLEIKRIICSEGDIKESPDRSPEIKYIGMETQGDTKQIKNIKEEDKHELINGNRNFNVSESIECMNYLSTGCLNNESRDKNITDKLDSNKNSKEVNGLSNKEKREKIQELFHLHEEFRSLYSRINNALDFVSVCDSHKFKLHEAICSSEPLDQSNKLFRIENCFCKNENVKSDDETFSGYLRSEESCFESEYEESDCEYASGSCSSGDDEEYISTEYTSDSNEATERSDFTERLPKYLSRFNVKSSEFSHQPVKPAIHKNTKDILLLNQNKNEIDSQSDISSEEGKDIITDTSSVGGQTNPQSGSESCYSKSDDSNMIKLSNLFKNSNLDDSEEYYETKSDRIQLYLERTEIEMSRMARCCCIGGCGHSENNCEAIPRVSECTINCVSCRGAGCEFRVGYTSNCRRDRFMYECVNNLTGRNCIGRIGKYGKILYPK